MQYYVMTRQPCLMTKFMFLVATSILRQRTYKRNVCIINIFCVDGDHESSMKIQNTSELKAIRLVFSPVEEKMFNTRFFNERFFYWTL